MKGPALRFRERETAGAGVTLWLPFTLFDRLLAAAVQLAALPPVYDETEMQRDDKIGTPLSPVGHPR